MPKYRVTHTGDLHYPPNRIAHPGDVVTDLPVGSVRWLKAEGLIEEVTPADPPKAPPPAPDAKEAP